MKRNINKYGRLTRAIIGVFSIAASIVDFFEDDIVDNGLLIIGVVLIAAAIIQICPLYYFLGINSSKTNKLKMY